YLRTSGHLGVRNWSSGTQTVSRNSVQSFAVGGGKVVMLFADDGYLRQQNLDGTGWEYAAVEGTSRVHIQGYTVSGNYLTYLDTAGRLRTRDLTSGTITVARD